MRIPLLFWFGLVTIAGCSRSLSHLFPMGLSCLLQGLGYFLGQSWQAIKMDPFQPTACLCLACQLRIAAAFPESYISTHSVWGLTSWLTNPKIFLPCSFILLTSVQTRSHSWLALPRLPKHCTWTFAFHPPRDCTVCAWFYLHLWMRKWRTRVLK